MNKVSFEKEMLYNLYTINILFYISKNSGILSGLRNLEEIF